MARPKRYYEQPDITELRDGFARVDIETIPAKDEDGSTMRCQFRAPAQLVEWASQIVATQKFPFTRDGDLYRWALFLGCVVLSGIDRTMPDFERSIERAAAVVRLRMRNATLADHLDHLALELEKLRKDGSDAAWAEVARMLDKEHGMASEEIAREPLWGARWRDELVNRFGHLRTIADVKKPIAAEYIDLRPSKAHHDEAEN